MDIRTANENHRPLQHFSVPKGWMNDPNGLIHHKGYYHLYYQHYPHATHWSDMHWGHARTKDFLHWEHLPIALYPDALGTIFSGSIVFDAQNTSGLGTTENPPLVALFTHHGPASERQCQSLAYSRDDGLTFTKYEGNPVIPAPPGEKDFRDPKVFWYEKGGYWVLVLAAGYKIMLYRSSNLLDWVHMSNFTDPDGQQRCVWECPDLFPLDGKWVLSLSCIVPRGMSPQMRYFIGDFDGKSFSSEKTLYCLPLDNGYDHYAAVTYSGTGDRRLLLGWLRGYNQPDAPEKGFRGTMSLPRVLRLVEISDSMRLAQQPAGEIEAAWTFHEEQTFAREAELHLPTLPCKLGVKSDHNIALRLIDAGGNLVARLGLDRAKGQMYVDTGKTFPTKERFPSLMKYDAAPLEDASEEGITLYLDTTCIELFTNSRLNVIASQYFSATPIQTIIFDNSQGIYSLQY